MMKSRTDADRLDRLLDGDEAAFKSLIEEYHSGMVKLASTFVDDESEAEEVVQETWAAVIDGLEDFEARSSLKTWIYSILTNLAKRRGEQNARTVNWSSLSDDSLETDVGETAGGFQADGHWTMPPRSWNADPEEKLLRADLLERIEEALDDLPARQAAVVRLSDVEGLSSEEVCDILDITRGNQRVLLHRGRTKVRDALDQYLADDREES